ncbi:bifunctional bis(5'-adenosyl)-triphosphatase/adenylylsulfatase FHIT [Pycnococcus provasolii]
MGIGCLSERGVGGWSPPSHCREVTPGLPTPGTVGLAASPTSLSSGMRAAASFASRCSTTWASRWRTQLAVNGGHTVSGNAGSLKLACRAFQFGPHIHIDAEQQIFAESKHSVALVNLKPVVPGHVLVAPKRLAARVSELDANELSDLFSLARDVGQTVQSHFNASSLTFTVQDGPEAGQTVPHVHVHVLPRRKGDFEPNDAVYDAVDASENDMGAARSLDDDRKPRSLQEMAAEAAELRDAMRAGCL